MARRRRKKTPSRKINNNILFVISIFIAAQVLFLSSSIFQIKSIDIVGESVYQSQILRSLNPLVGRHFFLLRLNEIKSQFKDVFWIKDVSISYSFPGKLKITVNRKAPQAYVSSCKNKNLWYEVSRDGSVMRQAGDIKNNLLKIVLDGDVAEGLKVDYGTLADAQKIYNILPAPLKRKLNYIIIDSSGEYGLNGDFLGYGLDVKIGDIQNLDYKLNLFTHLLNKTHGFGRKILYLDLRYEQPVIKVK